MVASAKPSATFMERSLGPAGLPRNVREHCRALLLNDAHPHLDHLIEADASG